MTIGIALAGCGQSNPMRDLAVAAGVTGGEPKPAPDFISRSRSNDTNRDYIPVGTSAPKRSSRPKSVSEVAASEADLEKTKAENAAKAAAP